MRRLTAGTEDFRVSWEGKRPGTATFRWSEVDRVIAFKRDLLTIDLVCLQIEARGLVLEVDEETEGWDELLEWIPDRLPGALSRTQVLGAVVRPAFTECRTVVYARPS